MSRFIHNSAINCSKCSHKVLCLLWLNTLQQTQSVLFCAFKHHSHCHTLAEGSVIRGVDRLFPLEPPPFGTPAGASLLLLLGWERKCCRDVCPRASGVVAAASLIISHYQVHW